MTLLIGVDAGGSRTTAAVADRGGAILARGEAGPGAVRPHQAAAAASAIALAVRDALQRARRTAPAQVLVVGASGAGREPERGELEDALRSHGLAHTLLVTTDAEIALEAAFGSGPGVVLIAGTGSVAWVRNADGTMARCGGLGPILGDQGSAYDIAREALRGAARAAEFEEDRALLDRIVRHLGIGEERLARWSLSASVAEMVQLAPVVLAAAAEGDAIASAVVGRAAADLAAIALHLLNPHAGGTMAWGGGLLAGAPEYRRMVLDRIAAARQVTVLDGPVDAAAGAISIAARLSRT